MQGRQFSGFNPLFLRPESRRQLHDTVRRGIIYGESRFRRILLVVATANEADQRWMQTCLREELYTVLSLIGTASAVGQVLDIPIIIKSLADSLPLVDQMKLPLRLNPSLFAILDAGVQADTPYELVDSYKFDWWEGQEMPAATEVLNLDNIIEAMEHHSEQRAKKKFASWLALPAPALKSLKAPGTSCPKCVKSQEMVTSLLAKMKSIRSFVEMAETDAESKMNEPREAGAVSSSGLAPVAQGQGETSQQWTWGSKLPEGDVGQLAHDSRRRRFQRSGYGHALPDGRTSQIGIDSDVLSRHPSPAFGSPVPPEVKTLPPSLVGSQFPPQMRDSPSMNGRRFEIGHEDVIHGPEIVYSPGSMPSESLTDLDGGGSWEDTRLKTSILQIETKVRQSEAQFMNPPSAVGPAPTIQSPAPLSGRSTGIAAAMAWASSTDDECDDQIEVVSSRLAPRATVTGVAAAMAWNEDVSDEDEIPFLKSSLQARGQSAGAAAAAAWNDKSFVKGIKYLGSNIPQRKQVGVSTGATAARLWNASSDDEADGKQIRKPRLAATRAGRSRQQSTNREVEALATTLHCSEAGAILSPGTNPDFPRTVPRAAESSGIIAARAWLSDSEDASGPLSDHSGPVEEAITKDHLSGDNISVKDHIGISFGQPAAMARAGSGNDADTEVGVEHEHHDTESNHRISPTWKTKILSGWELNRLDGSTCPRQYRTRDFDFVAESYLDGNEEALENNKDDSEYGDG